MEAKHTDQSEVQVTQNGEQMSPQSDNEELCIDVFDAVVETESGVVGLRLDAEQELVTVDYNTDQMDRDQAADLARRVGPILQQRWETCTMRLGQRGGRSCETCAYLLEQRLQKLPGIERASASYRGGLVRGVSCEDTTTRVGGRYCDDVGRDCQRLLSGS